MKPPTIPQQIHMPQSPPPVTQAQAAQPSKPSARRTGANVERPYVCMTCNKAFIQKVHLKRHEMTHTGERPFACHLCDKAFPQKVHLNRHFKTHTPYEPDPTAVEQTAAANQAAAGGNMAGLRKQNVERPFQCQHCNKAFIQKVHLQRHEKLHAPRERPFSCDTCGRSFFDKAKLKLHAKVHAVVNLTYPCSFGDCTQEFSSVMHVKAHEQTHMGQKTHACQFCQKLFTSKSNCKTHERIHTGERPFPCRFCPMAFAYKSHLVAHERIHTGEKPFPCPTCHIAAFKTNAELKKHMKIHVKGSGKSEPLFCDYCPKAFGSSEHLEKHLQTHLSEDYAATENAAAAAAVNQAGVVNIFPTVVEVNDGVGGLHHNGGAVTVSQSAVHQVAASAAATAVSSAQAAHQAAQQAASVAANPISFQHNVVAAGGQPVQPGAHFNYLYPFQFAALGAGATIVPPK